MQSGDTDTLSAVRRLSIGAPSGRGALGQVFSAFKRDSLIVVANGIDSEIREFDLSGNIVRRYGRSGQGPGEFLNLTWIAPLEPDSVIALDRAAGRVSIFGPRGVYARSFRLPVDVDEPVDRIAAYRDGFAIAFSRLPDPRRMQATTRDSFYVALIPRAPEPDSRLRKVLPPIPGRWWQSPGPGRLSALQDGPGALVSMSASGILVASSDRQEILRLDEDEWTIVRPVGRDWDNGMLQTKPEIRRPLYSALRIAPDGEFWLADAITDRSGLRTWSIFGPDGILRHVVLLPGDLSVLQAAKDAILARRMSEEGVETIELYELEASRDADLGHQ